jgi:hypothetical protein
MQVDYAAEWQRLTRLYEQMSEGELLELNSSFADLTEMAQQVLRDEMRKRGLDQPLSNSSAWRSSAVSMALNDTREDRSLADPDEDGQSQHEYTWKTLLCECESGEHARQIAEMLRRAAIECWIEADRSRSFDLRSPRVIVAADQLDQARQIAARPIPQDIIDESKMKVPDFESRFCPRCGAEDPVLESVEPSNNWSCESCGHEWSEPVEQNQSYRHS